MSQPRTGLSHPTASVPTHMFSLLLCLTAWAAAMPAAASVFGLECHITQRRPANCPESGCAVATIRPYDETRWYLADTDQGHIEEYALDGCDKGAPFRKMVLAESGEWSAEGGELGPGAGSVSLITFNPRTKVGGLSIMVMPGGEFGGGGSAYDLSARCTSISPEAVKASKRANAGS